MAALKALTRAGLTAQVGEIQFVHNFAHRCVICFRCLAYLAFCHIKTSAALTAALLREVE